MDREVDQFLERHPELSVCRESLNNMVETVVQIFRNGGTLFTCGNGGSAADSEHICGEFLKGFLSLRPLNADRRGRFESLFGDEGAKMAAKLQNGLRCISLLSHPAYVSAFANDVDAELVFVAYGISARIARTAVAELRKQGYKVGLLRPKMVFPFPERALNKIVRAGHVRNFLCVELSPGQMIEDVKLSIECRIPVHLAGRMGGNIPSVREICEKALALLKGGC